MSAESSRAATAATAPLKAHIPVYDASHQRSSGIDDVLGALIIGLAARHHARSECVLVAGKIERLLRRKIERGLLKGDRRDG